MSTPVALASRPWTRLKVAASLDGVTALSNGQSQWITSEVARHDGHLWRSRACAVLTGIGTVLADNPRLDVRLQGVVRQPHRVVVDSLLQTPENANLLAPTAQVWVYGAVADAPRQAALVAAGATVNLLPSATGKVDLHAMMADLAQRGVKELHVEAGYKLNGSLLKAGLVDELLVYLAPKLLGSGMGLAALGPLAALADGIELDIKSIDRMGPDVRIVAHVRRPEAT